MLSAVFRHKFGPKLASHYKPVKKWSIVCLTVQTMFGKLNVHLSSVKKWIIVRWTVQSMFSELTVRPVKNSFNQGKLADFITTIHYRRFRQAFPATVSYALTLVWGCSHLLHPFSFFVLFSAASSHCVHATAGAKGGWQRQRDSESTWMAEDPTSSITPSVWTSKVHSTVSDLVRSSSVGSMLLSATCNKPKPRWEVFNRPSILTDLVDCKGYIWAKRVIKSPVKVKFIVHGTPHLLHK